LSGLVNDSYCIGESLEIDRDSGSRSIKTTSDTENPSIVNVREVTQSLLERPCVLVVDDSIMVQKLLCRSHASLNFETDTACNGREGLIKMKGKRYRAVLVDFLMPVMDGIAATAEFRAWERDSSNDSATGTSNEDTLAHDNKHRQLVIGISANVSDAELHLAWKAGIDHFIRKPIKVCRSLNFCIDHF
jgi:CheY-like chemotaxis protein